MDGQSSGASSNSDEAMDLVNGMMDQMGLQDEDTQWESQAQAEADIIMRSLAQNRACAVVQEVNGGDSILIRCAAAVRRRSSCPFFYIVMRAGAGTCWRLYEAHRNHSCPESERVHEEMQSLENHLSELCQGMHV